MPGRRCTEPEKSQRREALQAANIRTDSVRAMDSRIMETMPWAMETSAISDPLETTEPSSSRIRWAMGDIYSRFTRKQLHTRARTITFRRTIGKENVRKERTVPISSASVTSTWIQAAMV